MIQPPNIWWPCVGCVKSASLVADVFDLGFGALDSCGLRSFLRGFQGIQSTGIGLDACVGPSRLRGIWV